MPLSQYDRYFGGKPGSAAKAKAAMDKEYGQKKGDSVFYATVNRRKSGQSPLQRNIAGQR
jgi:hypothetical protein